MVKIKKNNSVYTIKYKTILFLSMWICFLFAFIAIIIQGMDGIKLLTWNGIRGGLMPDLFESIWHSKTTMPYNYGAIYPPLTYFILSPFVLLIQKDYPMMDKFTELKEISLSVDGITIAILYSVCIFLSFLFILNKVYQGTLIEKFTLIMFFFTSSPFIYMYERGNIVILAMLCLFLYFQNIDSEKKYKQEIAIFFLSIAICLKIYPVFAGLYLLSKKKYKLIIKAILYSFLLFIIPFFYTGGLFSITDMINNILYLSTETSVDTRGFGYGFKVNITNTVSMMLEWLKIKGYIYYTDISYILKFATFFILIMLTYSILVLKEYRYKILSICLLMILLPPFSWIYNGIYMFIPFVYFVNNTIFNKQEYSDWLIIILLFLTFVPLPYFNVMKVLPGINPITLSTFTCCLSLIFLSFIIMFISIKRCFLNK